MTAVHIRVFPNAFVSAAIAILSTFNVLPAHAATRYVDAGGDLQAALDAAGPGAEIVLAAGARFVGEFVLPIKAAGAAITIRSSMTLPDRRLTPADAPLLQFEVRSNTRPLIDPKNWQNTEWLMPSHDNFRLLNA